MPIPKHRRRPEYFEATIQLRPAKHKLYEYAYAHFSNTGELIIDNDARYKRILKQSEVARTFFEAFKEKIIPFSKCSKKEEWLNSIKTKRLSFVWLAENYWQMENSAKKLG